MNHAEGLERFGDVGGRHRLVFSEPIGVAPNTHPAYVEQAARINNMIFSRRLSIEIEPVRHLNQGSIDLVILQCDDPVLATRNDHHVWVYFALIEKPKFGCQRRGGGIAVDGKPFAVQRLAVLDFLFGVVYQGVELRHHHEKDSFRIRDYSRTGERCTANGIRIRPKYPL